MARLVYSSGSRRAANCPRCNSSPCRCGKAKPVSPAEHKVGVRPERGGRGGKTVTTARPFFIPREDARVLLGELKRACGGGGTLKPEIAEDGRPCYRLELQGDHVERVLACLTERGYPARRSGG